MAQIGIPGAQAAVCIFAKPPVRGMVKTRLIPAVGADKAAELAEAFLRDTLRVVDRFERADLVIAATEPFVRDYLRGYPMWIQPEGDLGCRLEAILRHALLERPIALAIGADSPGLPLHCLDKARNLLRSHDAVLGPSIDGGFYLIGVKHCPPGLLSGIQWSTPTTMEQTISRLRQQGLSIALVPEWFDIDTVDELERLASLLRAGTVECPHTRDVLGSIFRIQSMRCCQ
ncbi:MAG: TIGR04282 family arsenosugar biosynthesis glycosyltransferase [Actinomycetota bacterium]